MSFPKHAVVYCDNLLNIQDWLLDNKDVFPDFIRRNGDTLLYSGLSPDDCYIVNIDRTNLIYSDDKFSTLSLCYVRIQEQIDFANACPALEILAIGLCGEADDPFDAIEADPALKAKYESVYTLEDQQVIGESETCFRFASL